MSWTDAVLAAWPSLTLDELTETTRPICYGVLKPGPDTPSGVPLIRIQDLRHGTVETSGLHYISPELDEEFARSRLDGGEVLLSIQGTIGRVAICPASLAGANISRTIAVIKPDDRVDARFLAYYFQLLEAGSAFPTQGATRASLNIGAIRQLRVPAPDASVQAAVSEQLDALLARVEEGASGVRRALRAVASFRAACLTAVFSGEYSGTGTPPSERLDEIADIQSGIAKGRTEDGVVVERPYLRTANVQGGFLDLSVIKTLLVTEAQVQKYRLEHEDVLVLEGGDADKVGRGWLWESQIGDCLHQNHVFAVRTRRDKLTPRFLAYYVNAPQARAYFLSCAKQTTNLASINKGQLKALPVPQFSADQQTELLEVLDAQMSVADRTENELRLQTEKAVQLRTALLHDAFRGSRHRPVTESSHNNRHSVLAGDYA